MTAHVFDRTPAQVGRAGQIDGQGALPGGLPCCQRDFIDWMRFENPCVIDQNIQPTQAINSLCNDTLGRSRIGDIARASYVTSAGKPGQGLRRCNFI